MHASRTRKCERTSDVQSRVEGGFAVVRCVCKRGFVSFNDSADFRNARVNSENIRTWDSRVRAKTTL